MPPHTHRDSYIIIYTPQVFRFRRRLKLKNKYLAHNLFSIIRWDIPREVFGEVFGAKGVWTFSFQWGLRESPPTPSETFPFRFAIEEKSGFAG